MVTIIIPVFNEEKVLESFYLELCKSVKRDKNFQIIFVDDGSSDNGLNLIKNIAAQDPRVKFISLAKNYGQQAAIYTGLKYARGNAVIVMDCDLQDPPELIPKMIKEWQDGAKVVLPLRRSRNDRLHKKLTAALFYTALNLCRKPRLNPGVGEFYLLDKSAVESIITNARAPLFLRGTVQSLSFKKIFFPFDRLSRKDGQSGYSYLKMISLARDAFCSQYDRRADLPDYEIIESNVYSGKTAAIIGAGAGGLITAYYLAHLGVKVSLYEKSSSVGGLAASELICGQKYDRYYHHIFRNDHALFDLLRILEMDEKNGWHKSSVGGLLDKKLYNMNSLSDLFRLPTMTGWSKIRMLFGAWRLARSKQIDTNISAKNVIETKLGDAAWRGFWQAPFESKFGRFSGEISASWFQARLESRAATRRCGREILGYPQGGFALIIDALKKEIIAHGGQIFTNTEISKITTKNHHFTLSLLPTSLSSSPSLSSSSPFDICISTLPPHLTKKIFPAYKSPPIEYIGFVGAILVLKKPFSPHYWINVLDKDAPFGVIVEQNNLSPLSLREPMYSSARGNLSSKDCFALAPNNTFHHILYLGKYTEALSDFYNLDDKIIKNIAADWLETIKPKVKSDIIEIKVFREPHAQPIITTKYKKPPHTCGEISGFYTTSMAHIFPADRGLNEAVKEAKKIVNIISQTL